MNDHHSHRRRASDPAWPTGDDPDSPARKREMPQERTGFWSPLWEDEDDGAAAPRSAGNGANGGAGNAPANGSAGRGTHRLPDRDGRGADQPASRPASGPAWPTANPAWPTEEPPSAPKPKPSPTAANGANGTNGVKGAGAANGVSGNGTNGRSASGQTTRVVRPRPARPGGPGGTGGPGRIPEGPTELLPPVHGHHAGPEPELLTHREPDYEGPAGDPADEADFGPEYEEEPPVAQDPRRRRKKVWRRVRRSVYVLIALLIIGPTLGFFIAYQMVEVPSPTAVRQDQQQVVTLTYADGSVMSKVVPPGGSRAMVKYKDIPKQVLHAVFAAEDSGFMTNPGFDISGVLNAAWNQVSGGTGGGSTITQQYIKKATQNEQKTLSRKALEVVKAYKMNNTYSKEDIIEAYLNIVYFGRGANGIKAAAQAYFGKDLKNINVSEAALLAGMIQNPSNYKDLDYMQRRWNYVMDQMVQNHWLSATERAAAKFPPRIPLEKSRPHAITGPRALIQQAAFSELAAAGLSEEDIQQKGLVIHTTIDKRAQGIAEHAVNDVMKDQPKINLPAMVAVNPANGEVVAYYGGKNGSGYDWAKAPQEPGSSFKPFDLVALLEKGKGLGEIYDGTSGRMFPGRATPVNNSDGDDSCGKRCSVAEAMKRSINTVFYDMAVNTVGTKSVARAAREAGILSDLNGPNKGPDVAPDGNIAIGGGDTRVSTEEMAAAYATFANGGMYHKGHLVSKVTFPDGGVVWQAPQDQHPAFDAHDADRNYNIARNVTQSLIPVINYSLLSCPGGRDCAGKTGTHQLGTSDQNAKAWMVGYTPQISVAVSMGAQDKKGNQKPVQDAEGKKVYGRELPGEIWQEFMDKYLANARKISFGPFTPIGKKAPVPGQSSKPSKPKDDGKDHHKSSQPSKPSNTSNPPSVPSKPSTPSSPPGIPGTSFPGFPGPGGPGGAGNGEGEPDP